jgi:hypothetical protein
MSRFPQMRTAAFCAVLLLSVVERARAEEKVDEALRRAAQYLLTQQDDAGFVRDKDAKRNETAMTSLAILALTSLGHQPGDPSPEGNALRRALAYVLQPQRQESDGYLGKEDGSRMYGHGITTLMLAEMLGMGADAEQDALLRERCKLGVELILRAQRVAKNDANKGGWRYTPDTAESDMSVTVWQTMALRAAHNAGIKVPGEAIENAVAYIKRCYDPEMENGKPTDAAALATKVAVARFPPPQKGCWRCRCAGSTNRMK